MWRTGPCARLGGSTELAGHLGDSHRLRQEDRIIEISSPVTFEPLSCWSTLRALSVIQVKVLSSGLISTPALRRSRACAGSD